MSDKEIIALKDQEIERQKTENAHLKFRIGQLEKLIFASSSEKFKSSVSEIQLNLFNSETEQSDVTQNAELEQISYTRKKGKAHPGRNKFPSHLPVEETIIEPTEDVSDLEKIGETISETLDYTPASLVIKRIIRPKYVNRKEEKILIGSLPERTFPKCIAENTLLAYILVSKFVDHLPYYRQVQRFKREFNWKVSQSTINNWIAACCTLLKPLYDRMQQQVIQSDYIQADESPIKVLDPEKQGKTHLGYQWVYHAPQKGIVVFNYRRGRGMHGPKEFLMQYEGILQCDGYTVYDKIGKKNKLDLVGCLVHARRKFYDALQSDKSRSEKALKIIKQIYTIEKQAKEKTNEEKQKDRLDKIKPLMIELLCFVKQESFKILPKSPIGKAMAYYQKQWPKLKNIFLRPEIELDNNLIENKIRPLALGRKNYLFAGSDKGAQWAAMMYSFFGTCKMHNIDPQKWLVNTLDNIYKTNIQDIDQFIPGLKV